MAEESQFSELSDFSQAAEYALVGYQMIEELLKSYIVTHYECIQKSLDGKIVFKFSEEEINTYSLERLITTFKKLNDNNDVILNLNKVKDDRNFIAHNAFAKAYFKNKRDNEPLDEDISSVEEMGKFVWKSFHQLSEEYGKVEKVLEAL